MASSFFSDFGLMWYLEELSRKELVKFKELLKQEAEELGLKQIPWSEVKRASKEGLANLLTKHYDGPQAWAVTGRVFLKINRKDLCVKALRESTGHTRKYRAHVKEKFSDMWRRNTITDVAEFFHQKITQEERQYLELFLRPEATEKQSYTVVLQGVQKIGKTMLLMKIILAWSDGIIGQDRFSYIFYFCCGELKKLPATSLAELISREWHEPSVPGIEITAQPERLLFIIDSFEKLKCDLNQPESELCSDWEEQQPVPVLVSSLLRKKMFPESSLIIATTPDLSQELEKNLKDVQVRVMMGFDDYSKKLYFSSILPNWGQAVQAFNAVQENKQLSMLCEMPLLCWLVCTCLKQEMERGQEPAEVCRCTTTLYTSFILHAFTPRGAHGPSPQGRGQLQGLCALAAEGMWTNTFVFPEDMLGRNGIATSDIATLLDTKILLKEHADCYSFLHLSVQEFCAALFHVLKNPSEHPHPAVASVDVLLMTYLERTKKNWVFLGCFLMGLLHENEQRKLDAFFGFQPSQEVKQLCHQSLRRVNENEDLQSQVDFSKLSYCLFEMQNDDFVRKVMEPIKKVNCLILDNIDLIIFSYCLKFCRSLRKLSLCIENIWAKQPHRPVLDSNLVCWDQICSVFRRNEYLFDLQMKDSILNESACVALYSHLREPHCLLQSLKMKGVVLNGEMRLFFDIFIQNPNIRHLSISSMKLSCEDVYLLCEALDHPICNIESLNLEDCSLSADHCNDMAWVLTHNKKLRQLSLTCNYLDTGVGQLCAALSCPEAVLDFLELACCYISQQCCPALSEMLVRNSTLRHLDLSLNILKDEGLEILCEALQLPYCSLRSLCITECGFSTHGCHYLVPVLMYNQNLRHLQIGLNALGDAGVKLLCEALVYPHCRIQTLGLQGCGLTSACCRDLWGVLTHSKTLEGLNLSSNSLDYSGVALLCKALQHPQCSLKVLWMGKGDLDEESWALLRTVEERDPELHIVSA
ncbi:NACHT, LRR and PYD domains-containing protein 4 [Dipodomys merriami]|uniref:NACHT, LRR and PYD domains-containing protein 4 n=1 Tax=Dipodomys merriami TaxID=94247 RepID=UPI003855BA73